MGSVLSLLTTTFGTSRACGMEVVVISCLENFPWDKSEIGYESYGKEYWFQIIFHDILDTFLCVHYFPIFLQKLKVVSAVQWNIVLSWKGKLGSGKNVIGTLKIDIMTFLDLYLKQ